MFPGVTEREIGLKWVIVVNMVKCNSKYTITKSLFCNVLTLSWRSPYHIETSPLIDMQSKPMDWFLYDRDLRHERVNRKLLTHSCKMLKYGQRYFGHHKILKVCSATFNFMHERDCKTLNIFNASTLAWIISKSGQT